MKNLKLNLKMYFSLLKMTFRGILQYRADFWMSLVSVVLLNGANIVQVTMQHLQTQAKNKCKNYF